MANRKRACPKKVRKRKPKKCRTRRPATRGVFMCPSKCPYRRCIPLEKSRKAFEQFLSEMRQIRGSNMTSVETRRLAESMWQQMDDDQKEKFVLLAQKAPYVFQPKNKFLCEIIFSIRLALENKNKVNLVELIRAARNMCHWKQNQLKCVPQPTDDIIQKYQRC